MSDAGRSPVFVRFAAVLTELKRRRVFRVIAAYAIVAWLIIEIASVILPAFDAPGWVLQVLILAAAAGGIAAVAISWVYDLTREGLVRTEPIGTDPDDVEANVAPGEPSRKDPDRAQRRPATVLRFRLYSAAANRAGSGPETFFDLLTRVQDICNSVVRRFDGSMVSVGSGEALVYFGIPLAHEYDARHAVRCGLALIEAVANLNDARDLAADDRLIFSAGIDSGTVVAGAAAGSAVSVVGPPVQGAGRLVALAGSNELLASGRTLERTGKRFNAVSVADGISSGEPSKMRVYRVVSESHSGLSSFASESPPTPLVGRQTECRLLASRLQLALSGQGQIVLISGEPGIGKTRLIGELGRLAAESPGTVVLEIACQSLHRDEAWFPIKQLLRQTVLYDVDSQDTQQCLRRLGGFVAQHAFDTAELLPLLCELLDVPAGLDVRALGISPEAQKKMLFEFLVSALMHRAKIQPLVLVGEDVQWADPTTLEFLRVASAQVPAMRMLIAVTFRTGFDPELGRRSYIQDLNLTRLAEHDIVELVAGMTGNDASAQRLAPRIFEKSDGVPLFAEELTRAIQARPVGRDPVNMMTSSPTIDALPASLQEALMWRLDEQDSARAVLQVAAVVGRDFDFEVLAQAGSFADHKALHQDLDKLIQGELLVASGFGKRTHFRFRHALLREAAYNSLLDRDRAALHGRIADILPVCVPQLPEDNPQMLAWQLERAGRSLEAAGYWARAGQREAAHSSNREAVANFQRALKCLNIADASPDNERLQLSTLTHLGPAMMALKGYSASEVESIYTRAQALSDRVKDPASLAAALFGQWAYHLVRGELERAEILGDRLLTLARSVGDDDLAMEAHQAVGVTHFHSGSLDVSLEHLRAVIAHYDPQRHKHHAYLFGQDPGVASHAYLASALWCHGKSDEAAREALEAETLAVAQGHAHSHAFALVFIARYHQHRGDAKKTLHYARTAQDICDRNVLPVWHAFATMLTGWAIAVPGHDRSGIGMLESGLAVCRQLGVGIALPFYECLLGHARVQHGEVPDGLAAIERSVKATSESGGTVELAEMLRLQAQAAAHQEPADIGPDALLREALAIAGRQNAWGWQLRIANDLAARLLAAGRVDDAAGLVRDALDKCHYDKPDSDHRDARELIERFVA